MISSWKIFSAIVFCLIGFSVRGAIAETETPGFSPTAEDFEFPLQDLEEMKGEVIWLQGGLKRGDPSPYQNPHLPLAAYEQGLLDREGNLWTFLDNPKGRELRYNKLLRGKVIEVKGWFYDRTQIIEVYSWKDSQSHPVRLDVNFPEPIKVPFESDKAETIEPIPPVNPEIPRKETIGEDMWKQKEGLELIDGDIEDSLPVPESTQDADLLQRFLEESELGEPPQTEANEPAPMVQPEQIDLRTEPSDVESSPMPPLPRVYEKLGPNTQGGERIREGITDPEEMFDASRKALLEQ